MSGKKTNEPEPIGEITDPKLVMELIGTIQADRSEGVV